jgi:leucyl-tRNA synthetase
MMNIPKSFAKRDAMIDNETKIRNTWNYTTEKPDSREKFFVTFPYPYMNGRLHLGHAYTVSKADFRARYERLRGKNVLFPFGFHGTGTPIVAAADKVKHELEMIMDSDSDESINYSVSQIDILKSMYISESDIPKFKDPNYWLEYFPKKAISDLKMLGISADFGRSFITTELNPHYDSFIKWQFSILEKEGILKFGKKHIIYSPKMDQPCSGHDRSKGEDVDPVEYTCIKLKLPNDKWYDNTSTYLIAATLRPETMYGQTNVWVNYKIMYSLFKFKNEYFIARYETFCNMSYQYKDVTLIKKEYITGSDLVGVLVDAPFVDNKIPVLNMNTVDENRGTGIVTSVPTDSPTDYLYWKKAVVENTVNLSTKLVGIISVNDDTTYAKTEIEKNKVKPGQTGKLELVHDKVYKNEHQFGIMMVGDYKGMPIKEAHSKIQTDLVKSNDAFVYYEPNGIVISRAGDTCVVAKTDQWYINYKAHPELTEMVNNHIDNGINMYNDVAKNEIKYASGWIKEWPCSRHKGLGTKLEVDERFVIDSLSDSTIYMAYYTVAHKIEEIPKDKLCNNLWDYLFRNQDLNDELVEYEELLTELKKEFKYWYPLNLRVSGKDLIKNHLIMCLYNHAFIWKNKDMLPKGFAVNGYTTLNKSQMSKSTGNFITLIDAVEKYCADATRIALALGTDTLDDANFDEVNAYEAVVFLSNEKDLIEDLLKNYPTESKDDDDENVWDVIFTNKVDNGVNDITDSIENMMFRKAFVDIYGLVSAKDTYKNIYKNKMDSIPSKFYRICFEYVEKFVNVMEPFCPFWTESVRQMIKSYGKDIEHSWPVKKEINTKYMWLDDSFNTLLGVINKKYTKITKKVKGDAEIHIDVITKPTDKEIYILKTLQNSDDPKSESIKLMKICKNKKDKAFTARTSKNALKNVNIYGPEWYNWNIIDNTFEFDMINKWIHIVLDFKCSSITVQKNTKEYNPLKNNKGGNHVISVKITPNS